MTLQAKGFRWSIGIHGMLLLVVAAFQVLAVSQSKSVVIDFTLPDNHAPSAVEQFSPYRAPVARPELKHAKAVRPKEVVKEVVEEHSAPNPNVEEARLPSEVSGNEEAIPPALPQAVDGPGAPLPEGQKGAIFSPRAAHGPGTPAAKRAFGEGADTAGSAQGATGGSGNGGPGAALEKSREAYLKEHFVYIRERITGNIAYPHMARKMGWCGQVKIEFVVCEDGGVNDVRVVESSGFGLLDRNAVDTVKNVAPFPSPPVKAEIRMAITYRLN